MKVAFGDIWKMMKSCAAGYEKRMNQSNDRWVIEFEGKTAWLPAGQHGRRSNRTEIHWTHVKNAIGAFGLSPDCVRTIFGHYKSEREKLEAS